MTNVCGTTSAGRSSTAEISFEQGRQLRSGASVQPVSQDQNSTYLSRFGGIGGSAGSGVPLLSLGENGGE